MNRDAPAVEEKRLFARKVNEAVKRVLRDRYLPAGIHSHTDGLADQLIGHFTSGLLTVDASLRANGARSHGQYRRFKQRFGMTPGQFLQQARFLSAYFLLRAGWSVAEAAGQSGFLLERKLLRAFTRILQHGGRDVRLHQEPLLGHRNVSIIQSMIESVEREPGLWG